MPRPPPSAERLIQAAIAALVSALTEARVPWMIIGGIAVIARGVRRMTADVDAVVLGDAIDVDSLGRDDHSERSRRLEIR